ncbi:MAG: hypothetical protein QM743_08835 [Chitinophagaceae bacterium]
MTNASEKGHLRNATAFTELVAICSSLGASYRPSNPLLALTALGSQSNAATESVNSVMALLNDYYNAVNLRQSGFAELAALSSRILSYFRSCGASEERVNDLKAYHKKLQGSTRRKPSTAAPVPAGNPEPAAQRVISTSQLSYDQKSQHFLSMIDILMKEPLYSPLEDELTVAQLSERHRQLLASSAAVQTQKRLLDNARALRNELLYSKNSGVADVARAIKQYLRAAFGEQSAAWKQAVRLSISKPRTK